MTRLARDIHQTGQTRKVWRKWWLERTTRRRGETWTRSRDGKEGYQF